MTDLFGRNIDYLRVSVTDRCNLRCVYCMPDEGVASLSHEKILTFDEIEKICALMAKDGLKKVKITGGEPLVRKDVANLIGHIKNIDGIENVTITTNGVLLSQYYDDLIKSGIDSITVSLDTIDNATFQKVTRRDLLNKVLEGIEKAVSENKVPLKINSVPVFGNDEQEITNLLNFAKKNKIDIRFIEMMPIGLGTNFNFVAEDKIKEIIERDFGKLQFYKEKRGNGPAHYYSVDGFEGKIGFISALSHKFCDECNRVRLTSNGFLKTCLQFDCGADLMPFLRESQDDDALREIINNTIKAKPKSHHFDLKENFLDREQKKMSQIGG